MKLYNTLTRQVDAVIPLSPGKLGIYTCGPTVYDYAHIGHWFNYIRMDTLIRGLQAEGFITDWVMNITDVGHLVSDADDGEDKLEKGARREGKTAWEVAEFYTKDFLECMNLLQISRPSQIVQATDHIAEQIALIVKLADKGFTYIIDDGVYYDTSKFEGYAAFAGLDLEEQQAGARVSVNDQKRNQSDFALWKFSPAESKRDMEWDSPFGDGKKGFPGWHIECSAMSMKYLGESFDIHTGGIDHIPVHHTNEIAQSEAATGKRFANYWFHSNHVTVNGEKISKSLGNGIRLQEIIDKGISPAAVRLNVLESHYRSQSKFSWESLEATANRLKHWYSVAELYWQPQNAIALSQPQENITVSSLIEQEVKNIAAALSDDLNTPLILSIVDRLFSQIETRLLRPTDCLAFAAFIEYIKAILGIDLLAGHGDAPNDVVDIITARQTARGALDWTKSDQLRGLLLTKGFEVKDLPGGHTIWSRL